MADVPKSDLRVDGGPSTDQTRKKKKKRRRLSLDIDEVDVSEVLERKISA